MYSNERGSKFNILDLLVKIIFFILFILALLWLFPKVPNMTPFYSNVFRENINAMQSAAEGYFTTDKMPKEVGESVKLTLSELFNMKLVLPFVDKDGNSCNQYESYVSVTKDEDERYSLKTNLICNEESDYLIKILGCHNYCLDKDCAKICHKEQLTMYQFKKPTTKTVTSVTCPSGYTKKNNNCYKTVLKDSISAVSTIVTDETLTMPPKTTYVPGTKLELSVIRTQLPSITNLVYDTPVLKSGGTQQVPYDCSSSSTGQSCRTEYKTESYSCNCTTHTVHGKPTVSCNTCTRSIPYEVCEPVTVTTPGTCYHTVPLPDTYVCPSQSTNSSGSGSTLRCWHYNTTSGGYSTSCPLTATNYSGSGDSLRCYKVTEGRTTVTCTDSTYKLVNGVCTKKVTGTQEVLGCPKSYVLEGKKCNLYDTETKKPTIKKTTKKTYKYKWSESPTLSGWTKTGKTKIVEGEEVCE